MNWDVHPGLGLGGLRFGASQQQVEAYLGAPEEVIKDTLGDDGIITWYYWDSGISASFYESDGYRLSLLQVDNPHIVLQERQYIGLREEELLAIIEGEDWGTVEVDTNPGWITITVWTLGVTFSVPTSGELEEQGVVSSIQLSPLLDEHENTVWPSLAV